MAAPIVGEALVPGCYELLGIFEGLPLGGAACGSFLFGGLPALVFHFALLKPMTDRCQQRSYVDRPRSTTGTFAHAGELAQKRCTRE